MHWILLQDETAGLLAGINLPSIQLSNSVIERGAPGAHASPEN